MVCHLLDVHAKHVETRDLLTLYLMLGLPSSCRFELAEISEAARLCHSCVVLLLWLLEEPLKMM